MKDRDKEYTSSVTLMFLGDDLVPSEITKLLSMRPSKSWQRGSKKDVGNSLHAWGGWKKFLPESYKEKSLDIQLAYWARRLTSKKVQILNISKSASLCSLDCFITTDATSSIILPVTLQKAVAELGLELRLTFWAG